MNRLIVCVTVYQLFNAINFTLNKFNSNDKVDLVLLDKTDFREIINRIDGIGIFNNVYYVENDKFYKTVFTKYLKNNDFFKECFLDSRIDLVNYNKLVKYYLKDTNFSGNYDELYIGNYNRVTNILYNYLMDRNKNIRVYEYEDGLGSYVITRLNFKFLKNNAYIKFLGKLGTRTLLPELIEGIYLYAPNLYCKNDSINKLKINEINKNDKYQLNVINKIFDYKDLDFFDRKFIIFEQPFKEDGVEANDFELFEEIINKLGEENVIVKLHPRSKRNRFEKFQNIKIYNQVTPWELICMNEDLKDKILITVSSTAIFTPIILFGESCCAVSLCKLLKSSHLSDYSKNIEEYFVKVERYYGSNFILPETMEMLFENLNKM